MERTEFSKKLCTKSFRCVTLSDDKRVKQLFFERWEEVISDNVRLYWSRNSSEPFTQLAGCIDTVAKIAVCHDVSSNSSRQPSLDLSSSRNGSIVSYQLFGVLRDTTKSCTVLTCWTHKEQNVNCILPTDQVSYGTLCVIEDLNMKDYPNVRDIYNLDQIRKKNWEIFEKQSQSTR